MYQVCLVGWYALITLIHDLLSSQTCVEPEGRIKRSVSTEHSNMMIWAAQQFSSQSYVLCSHFAWLTDLLSDLSKLCVDIILSQSPVSCYFLISFTSSSERLCLYHSYLTLTLLNFWNSNVYVYPFSLFSVTS